MPSNNKQVDWVIASLDRLNIEKENVSLEKESFPKGTELRLHTETKSNFAVGVMDPQKPNSFNVQLEYSVTLKADGAAGKTIFNYASSFVASFNVLETSKDFDWLRENRLAFSPYFSFVHYEARQRAQRALEGSGLHGPLLPVPEVVAQGRPSAEQADASTNATKVSKPKRARKK